MNPVNAYEYTISVNNLDGNGLFKSIDIRSNKDLNRFKEWFFDYSKPLVELNEAWMDDFKESNPTLTRDTFELLEEAKFENYINITLSNKIKCFYTHTTNVNGSHSALANFVNNSNTKRSADLMTYEEIENEYLQTDNNICIVGFGLLTKSSFPEFKQSVLGE